MKKSFSLIELLISLIIISLLIAAFAPLITKKLKASSIVVGSFSNNEGQVIQCKEGYHQINNKCFADILHCLDYSIFNKCIKCDTGYEVASDGKCQIKCNCTNGSCAFGTTYCDKCNSGFTLYDNQCVEGVETNCYDFFCSICKDENNGTCSVCKQGYVLHEGKCYFGTLEGCINPIYDDEYLRINCQNCQSEYTKCNSGSCTLLSKLSEPCPNNSIKVGCICVAKYNIGDGKYGENLDVVKTKCTAGADCNVTNGSSPSSTARNLDSACWQGTTAMAGHCNSDFGGYNGCKRTLCNWTGAYEVCQSIGWRLPTFNELSIFTSTTYSNSTKASAGLMFCDLASGSAPWCNGRDAGGCNGAQDRACRPFYLWSLTFYSNVSVRTRLLHSNWKGSNPPLSRANSARCVKDL